MPQNPLSPLDDGRLSLPPVSSAMTRVAPNDTMPDDKGTANNPLIRDRDEMDEQEFLARVRKRFDRCVSAEAENRKEALQDLEFFKGHQWSMEEKTQRQLDGRPALTINTFPTLLHQVMNDQRQNRPTINISPNGDRADVEAAKMFRGMIRSIEQQSAADIAYDCAFESAAKMGWGYFRILTDYESADSFDQSIFIKQIIEPFTVYFDPDAVEPDGSDAHFAFVTQLIPRDDFKAEFPDVDQMPWSQAGVGDKLREWVQQHHIRIAEYFEIEHETRTLVKLSTGHTGWEDELSPSVKAEIAEGTITIDQERESQVPCIYWYKLTAKNVLECQKWPGRYIPIVPVYGDRVAYEGKRFAWGLIRMAKDAARMRNYWETLLTETIALAPKAPYIMAAGQQEGFEPMWRTADTKNWPYLLYNTVDIEGKPAPAPQRNQLVGTPQGIQQALQNNIMNLQATTGIRFDATKNETMMDESGKAIKELRRAGDLGSFHLVDNLSHSLKHCGRILIDLIPKVYSSQRVMTILREDDKEELIRVDPKAQQAVSEQRDQRTGKVQRIFNPNYGEYGVTVDIGPSYATKRIEAAESMIQFIRAVPQVAPAVVDLIAKNLDWPNADEFAARLAKTLDPKLLTPENKDVPPQLAAMLTALQQQVQQLTHERTEMLKQLADKNATLALSKEKIDNDFEAKLLAIVQKSESTWQNHVGSQLKDLAQGVQTLMKTLQSPQQVQQVVSSITQQAA